MVLKSKSPWQTQKIASDLAKKIKKAKTSHHACVIALEGELGAGKTTFVKGFAKTLGIRSHITSPTFVLLKNYKLPAYAKALAGRQTTNGSTVLSVSSRGSTPRGSPSKDYKLLFHIDAYRLKDYRDLIPLGIKEIIADPQNIVLIEWSERVRRILPRKHTKIHIDHISESSRKIEIK